MLDEAKILEGEKALKALSGSPGRQWVVLSDSRALRLHMMQFDIGGQQGFPDATWGEYFAIAALMRIGQVLSAGQSKDREVMPAWSEVEREALASSVESVRLELLLEAAELVSVAEFLSNGTGELSRAGRKGGLKKVKKLEALKRYVHEEWLAKYQHRSNRNAARRIWRDMPPNLMQLLSTDDPEKRLEVWIGKWRRELE